MTSIREAVRKLLIPAKPLPPGIYHYQAPQDDPRDYRLHLRIEPGGTGILIVNASTVLHLNTTATEHSYHLVQRTPEEEVAKNMASRYRVNRMRALDDYLGFVERIDALIDTPDLDPVTFLDFERQLPYSGEISAPYRLDCALTYRLRETADTASAPTSRVTRELPTEEWITVLDKAWNAGIPHVIFTGGEPTLRDDLVSMIGHAERNGQVAGLLTDGYQLSDPAYLQVLLQTGLDHLMIVLHTEDERAWEALQAVLAEDIFTAVHVTITHQNRGKIPQILTRLANAGVRSISLSENAPDLTADLQAAREYAASLDLSLVWDLPVPYSSLNPVSLEVEERESVEGAGRAWLYVEPDGDVLPAQGNDRVLGNLVTDSWEKIWKG